MTCALDIKLYMRIIHRLSGTVYGITFWGLGVVVADAGSVRIIFLGSGARIGCILSRSCLAAPLVVLPLAIFWGLRSYDSLTIRV